jgi:hypothetical protein
MKHTGERRLSDANGVPRAVVVDVLAENAELRRQMMDLLAQQLKLRARNQAIRAASARSARQLDRALGVAA